jgi:hypothetical protein
MDYLLTRGTFKLILNIIFYLLVLLILNISLKPRIIYVCQFFIVFEQKLLNYFYLLYLKLKFTNNYLSTIILSVTFN